MSTLDPEDPRPAYRQVQDRLRADIATGRLSPGDRLPSYRELSETFGIAVETVKRALDQLRTEGLVVTRQGTGTFVRTDASVEPDAGGLELARLQAQIDEHARRLDELERRLAKG